MILFVFVFFCFILHGIIKNWKKKDRVYYYLDKESCNAVKGVFIFLVLGGESFFLQI